ncbi:MAG TPA: GAF domain-containing sensor histidine kinase [Anaerolineales bacterium]|nr:GAF domain-containing sensor histidine kinase [Anaerolineales bacterium]
METAASLNTQFELVSVLEALCNLCNQALKADQTVICVEDARKQRFQIMAVKPRLAIAKNKKKTHDKIPGKILETIVSENDPVTFVRDLGEHPDLSSLDLFRKQNLPTVGIAGMYRQHRLIGAVIVILTRDSIELIEDTRVLLKGLADQATISITNASLYEQVRRGREFQRALTTQLVEIQETERRHLAMELHDQIGQVLTGLQFMLESAKNKTNKEQAAQIREAQETVRGLIEQIREMSLNLRPSMLDDMGLLPTLLWHFERYTKQTGIKVSFIHNRISERLLPDVETAVYRIVQEALTNIARYAQASEAFVQLVRKKGVLEIAITDHGVGFDPGIDINKAMTAGLTGMRERANILGGNLVVKSALKKGTQVLVTLPLGNQPVERRKHVRDVITG